MTEASMEDIIMKIRKGDNPLGMEEGLVDRLKVLMDRQEEALKRISSQTGTRAANDGLKVVSLDSLKESKP